MRLQCQEFFACSMQVIPTSRWVHFNGESLSWTWVAFEFYQHLRSYPNYEPLTRKSSEDPISLHCRQSHFQMHEAVRGRRSGPTALTIRLQRWPPSLPPAEGAPGCLAGAIFDTVHFVFISLFGMPVMLACKCCFFVWPILTLEKSSQMYDICRDMCILLSIILHVHREPVAFEKLSVHFRPRKFTKLTNMPLPMPLFSIPTLSRVILAIGSRIPSPPGSPDHSYEEYYFHSILWIHFQSRSIV